LASGILVEMPSFNIQAGEKFTFVWFFKLLRQNYTSTREL
jgi:hypothetical protein